MLVCPTRTRHLYVDRSLSPGLAHFQRVLFSTNSLRLDGTRHENAIINVAYRKNLIRPSKSCECQSISVQRNINEYVINMADFSCTNCDVSNEVGLQTCVAETEKTVLFVTSDIRLPPRGMIARLTFRALSYNVAYRKNLI